MEILISHQLQLHSYVFKHFIVTHDRIDENN